jgi:hypothetical protein
MKASLYHLQINVTDLSFYRDLFAYFDYRVVDEWDDGFGVTNGTVDFWIFKTEEKYSDIPFHRKATGLNHIAFKVASASLVDVFVKEFLVLRGIEPLYGRAKVYAEYGPHYYAVYFEGPERLKIEVMSDVLQL